MDFSFNEEQRSLGDTIRQIVADHVRLIASDPAEAQDASVWGALADLGLFALLVPEAHGGVGLSMLDVALAIEELGAGLAPPLVTSTMIATDLLVRFGSDEQRADLLPRIAAGDMRIALAVHEAEAGYDPGEAAVTAGADGVAGRKILVSGAMEADAFLVLARVDGQAGLVLVRADPARVTVRAHEDIDPSSGLCEIVIDGAPLTAEASIGAGQPSQAITRLHEVAATVYAGMATGIAARMLDMAVDYAKTRQQFGQPIGAFQSIKHRCADMAVAVEAARSAAYYAFWAVTEDAPDHGRASSMAKAYCGEVTRDVCNETIQIHGGMGFTWELGLHRFLRRAKVMEHAFGNPSWHYERVLAETLAALDTTGAPERNAA